MILTGQEFQARVSGLRLDYQHLYQMYAYAVDNYAQLQIQSPAHSIPWAVYMRDQNMIAIAMVPENHAEEDENLEYAHALEYLKVIAC